MSDLSTLASHYTHKVSITTQTDKEGDIVRYKLYCLDCHWVIQYEDTDYEGL